MIFPGSAGFLTQYLTASFIQGRFSSETQILQMFFDTHEILVFTSQIMIKHRCKWSILSVGKVLNFLFICEWCHSVDSYNWYAIMILFKWELNARRVGRLQAFSHAMFLLFLFAVNFQLLACIYHLLLVFQPIIFSWYCIQIISLLILSHGWLQKATSFFPSIPNFKLLTSLYGFWRLLPSQLLSESPSYQN